MSLSSHKVLFGALALAFLGAATAFAGDGPAPGPVPPARALPSAPSAAQPDATPPAVQPDATPPTAPAVAPTGCVALLPAHTAWVDRQVNVPAVTTQRQVPVTQTVKVPVYGTLTVPQVQQVEVPRYERKKKAVKLTLWNPFKCFKEFDVKLFDRTKCVQVGTEIRQQVVPRTQQVVVGEREEQRVVGYRTETVVVTPAHTETVHELATVPEQWVTLGPSGTPPLPGTSTVMTQEDYRTALASAAP